MEDLLSNVDLWALAIGLLIVVVQMGSPYAKVGALQRIFYGYPSEEVRQMTAQTMAWVARQSVYLLIVIVVYWAVRFVSWAAYGIGSLTSNPQVMFVAHSMIYQLGFGISILVLGWVGLRHVNRARLKRTGTSTQVSAETSGATDKGLSQMDRLFTMMEQEGSDFNRLITLLEKRRGNLDTMTGMLKREGNENGTAKRNRRSL